MDSKWHMKPETQDGARPMGTALPPAVMRLKSWLRKTSGLYLTKREKKNEAMVSLSADAEYI